MKLYYFPLSTYCQKAMIAFEEKGVSYEPELVELMNPEARAAYEEIYPSEARFGGEGLWVAIRRDPRTGALRAASHNRNNSAAVAY